MANTNQLDPHTQAADVIVCLPSMSAEALQETLRDLATAWPSRTIVVATPDQVSEFEQTPSLRIVGYESSRSPADWALTAADYLAAGTVAKKFDARNIFLLGSSDNIVELLQIFSGAMSDGTDMVLPQLITDPSEGLVNAAMIYPLTRALFGMDIRFPLPMNVALSGRAAARLSLMAQRPNASSTSEPLIWPVSEAAVTSFSVRQVNTGEQSLPQPNENDFNRLFTGAVGSLFADIEIKASFWQRGQSFSAPSPAKSVETGDIHDLSSEIRPMVESFHLAYANLQEIWSLVLPPQSLLALKRLSQAPAETFAIAPNLWARLVYDFVLAFHLRTINRGHLLGALTPLYLAWVASQIRLSGDDPARAASLIEDTALAFLAEKPYLVSRWRWPDRFNP